MAAVCYRPSQDNNRTNRSRKMKKFLASLTAVAAITGSIQLMADDGSKATDPKATPPSTFSKMDKNGDGKVSADEYKSYWVDVFGMIDIDKDGKVSESEHQARIGKRISEVDKDKDVSLTKEEFIDTPKPSGKLPEKGSEGAFSFKKADINADGSITVEEYYLLMGERFDKYDKSKDGKLDKDEMSTMFLEVFRIANVDKDGNLTKDEWIAYWVGVPSNVEKKAEPAKDK